MLFDWVDRIQFPSFFVFFLVHAEEEITNTRKIMLTNLIVN